LEFAFIQCSQWFPKQKVEGKVTENESELLKVYQKRK